MSRTLATIALLACAFAAGCNSAPSTDIWKAASDGNVDALKQHVAAGTEINQTLTLPGQPGDGGSPLHLAAITNQTEAIDFLIANGAQLDLRASDDNGASPLMWAAAFGQVEAATRLIAAGADVNYVDNNGATAIDATLLFEPHKNREAKQEIANLLRAKGGQSSTTPEASGDIWAAAATGNTVAVTAHLDGGADVNGIEPASRATPLIAAAVFGQTTVAQLLIERGADIEITGGDGSTPLHVAALFAYPEFVTLLIDKGAVLDARNHQGQTPLDRVSAPWSPPVKGMYDLIGATLKVHIDIPRIKAGRTAVATILREQIGVSPETGSDDTNIVLAVTKGYLPTVKEYLDDGGDPDRLEPLGKSPLLLVACLHGHADVVEAFLASGAAVNLQNPEGETPLHIAVLVAYPEVVKLLLKHGANTTIRNKKGQPPTATVEVPWAEIKPIYGLIGAMLQMQFDTNRIEKERVVVAELLKTHAAENESGQSTPPVTEAP